MKLLTKSSHLFIFLDLVNSPGFAHPTAHHQHHFHTHQKSASFGSNLYQQSTNIAPHSGFQSQVCCTNKQLLFFIHSSINFISSKVIHFQQEQEWVQWIIITQIIWVHLPFKVHHQHLQMIKYTKCFPLNLYFWSFVLVK